VVPLLRNVDSASVKCCASCNSACVEHSLCGWQRRQVWLPCLYRVFQSLLYVAALKEKGGGGMWVSYGTLGLMFWKTQHINNPCILPEDDQDDHLDDKMTR
jgi:hypothetical protein